jgi:hypothetical protein
MKPARAVEQVSPGSNCADRILKIVDGLQHEIKDREASFQVRLRQVIEETQRRVEEHFRVQHERAVSEAQAATRSEVTYNLLTRFDVETFKLQTDFERRLRETVAQTEAAGEAKLEHAIADANEILQVRIREEAAAEYQSKLDVSQKLIALLEERARAASSEWQAERQRFQERIATLERIIETTQAVNTEKSDEDKELARRLDEALEAKAQLGLDLQRSVSEFSARTQSQPGDESDRAVHGEVARIVQCEVARIQLIVNEIEKTLSDSIDLAAGIRLNRERAELQAYLKGLRYSLGDVTLQSSPVQESSTVQDPCNA